ncbi:MAG: DMT family transporter [Lachnospiraceae bacterium]|nr:DMT family transporter [Lachnospiraceae bacterium]
MKSIKTFLGAVLCCVLWGSAFPVIKIGYDLWGIDGSETMKIIEFAGWRFFLAGVLVILFESGRKKTLILPKKTELPKIMKLSLFQTIGQYILFYLGLAHTSGVNAAVVDSLTTVFAILVASFLFRTEKLTGWKLIGCVAGFIGVTIINLTGDGFQLNLLGDGLVTLSAFCYGISSSMIKKYSAKHDTVMLSGYQFLFGGLVMSIFGMSGGKSSVIKNPDHIFSAMAILLYLALVSSVAYTLWGILLRRNEVSKIAIFGFMTPVAGAVLSMLLLGEAKLFDIRYVIALILISLGILLVNKTKKENSSDRFDE